jgi:anti-anti-sigma factor
MATSPMTRRSAMTPRRTPSLHRSGDFAVTLTGEVDLAKKTDLARIVDAFRGASAASVSVDLHAVTFLDTTCLTFLGRLRDIAVQRGGTVAIVGASRSCLRTLSLVGFDSEFHLVA